MGVGSYYHQSVHHISPTPYNFSTPEDDQHTKQISGQIPLGLQGAQVIVGFTTSPAGEVTGAPMTLAAKRMVLVRRTRVEGTGKCILQVLSKSEWKETGEVAKG